MKHPIVLSHYQTKPLLEARRAGERCVEISLDLGLTTVEALLEADCARFPHDEALDWEAIAEIDVSENSCFLVQGGQARKIQIFSGFTDRLYSLMPTPAAPTMLVSGIPMHRIKGTDPYQDTLG